MATALAPSRPQRTVCPCCGWEIEFSRTDMRSETHAARTRSMLERAVTHTYIRCPRPRCDTRIVVGSMIEEAA